MAFRKPEKRLITEVFSIPFGEKYIIYAPLRKAAFIANSASVNLIYRLKNRAFHAISQEERAFAQFMDNLGILGDEGDVQAAPLIEDIEFRPTYITLFLTTKCNLNCIYCYASAGATSQDMTLDIARKGIDFIYENAIQLGQKEIDIGYHGGGEPTVNWKVFVGSLGYARTLAAKQGIQIFASAASNGIFSAEQCKWIIENLQSVNLSVDGLPEIHDMQRPSRNGKPSSSHVLKTINAFEKASFRYSIRATVTSFGVERLAEGILFLLNRSKPKRILVEPVYNIGKAKDGNIQVDPVRFITSFREAKRIADRYAVPFLFSAASLDVISSRFCGICGEGMCLTPRGKVSACYEVVDENIRFAEEFIFGRYDPVRGRFVFSLRKLRKLQGRSVENISWCKGCFAKWHCAGDCPNLLRHYVKKGEFRGSPRCEITRELIRDQILDRINRSGGLFWRGNVDEFTNRLADRGRHDI